MSRILSVLMPALMILAAPTATGEASTWASARAVPVVEKHNAAASTPRIAHT